MSAQLLDLTLQTFDDLRVAEITFLKVDGCEIGTTSYDEEGTELVPEVVEKTAEGGRRASSTIDFVARPSVAQW